MTVESVPPVVDANAKDNKGLAIASFVLGIISFCGGWVPYLNWCLSLALLAGIITGIMGLKSTKKGLAIAGLVLSILAVCGVIISNVMWGSLMREFIQNPSQWQDYLNQMNQFNY